MKNGGASEKCLLPIRVPTYFELLTFKDEGQILFERFYFFNVLQFLPSLKLMLSGLIIFCIHPISGKKRNFYYLYKETFKRNMIIVISLLIVFNRWKAILPCTYCRTTF